jgi:hypothetical protein
MPVASGGWSPGSRSRSSTCPTGRRVRTPWQRTAAGGCWVTLWAASGLAHLDERGTVAAVHDLGEGAEPHGVAVAPDGAVLVALERARGHTGSAALSAAAASPSAVTSAAVAGGSGGAPYVAA